MYFEMLPQLINIFKSLKMLVYLWKMIWQMLKTEKVRQLRGWEVPEQILNKLKSKWFVEMAAKNLSDMILKVFNKVNFSFLPK